MSKPRISGDIDMAESFKVPLVEAKVQPLYIFISPFFRI